jgi:hypothetical protein
VADHLRIQPKAKRPTTASSSGTGPLSRSANHGYRVRERSSIDAPTVVDRVRIQLISQVIGLRSVAVGTATDTPGCPLPVLGTRRRSGDATACPTPHRLLLRRRDPVWAAVRDPLPRTGCQIRVISPSSGLRHRINRRFAMRHRSRRRRELCARQLPNVVKGARVAIWVAGVDLGGQGVAHEVAISPPQLIITRAAPRRTVRSQSSHGIAPEAN